jgi:hypothetical protein
MDEFTDIMDEPTDIMDGHTALLKYEPVPGNLDVIAVLMAWPQAK